MNFDPQTYFKKIEADIHATARECLVMESAVAEELPIETSKFGGFPCLPTDFPYPTTSEGEPLYLMAQINFSEIPSLKGYPSEGLLQFFIANDDHYGHNFDARMVQTNWRVLFFPKVDFEPGTDLPNVMDEKRTLMPLRHDKVYTLALTFQHALSYPVPYTIEFEELILPLFDVEGEHLRKLEDHYFETLLGPGLAFERHQLGGYPYFTQDDPRNWEPYQRLELLLQISSEPKKLIWGDMGVAGLFIAPDRLSQQDFSELMYTWDCS